MQTISRSRQPRRVGPARIRQLRRHLHRAGSGDRARHVAGERQRFQRRRLHRRRDLPEERRLPDAVIRLGWEFDGGWMPWSSPGNEALWVQAYRHVHDVFRGGLPGFKFDWNGDSGYLQGQTAAYPGDSYVDVVGIDLYDKGMGGATAWNSSTRSWSDPNAAWSRILPNLQWQRDFADLTRQARELSRMGTRRRERHRHVQRRRRQPDLHLGHVQLDDRAARERRRQPDVPVVLQRGHRRRQPQDQLRLVPERVGPLQGVVLERRRRLDPDDHDDPTGLRTAGDDDGPEGDDDHDRTEDDHDCPSTPTTVPSTTPTTAVPVGAVLTQTPTRVIAAGSGFEEHRDRVDLARCARALRTRVAGRPRAST